RLVISIEWVLAYRLRFYLAATRRTYGNFAKRERRDRLDITVGDRYPDSYFAAAVHGSGLHVKYPQPAKSLHHGQGVHSRSARDLDGLWIAKEESHEFQ